MTKVTQVMTNCKYPFNTSKQLADWTTRILTERDIDCLIDWRMLEQWMQTEIFRAIDTDTGNPWRHFGYGEQPYCCDMPKSLSKPTSVPRIDLVFAQPEFELPQQIIWFELKHIGRSQETLQTNANNLGADLIALYSINPAKTKELWLNPPGHVVNANKTEFWKKHAHGIERAEHFYAQVVLIQKDLADLPGNETLVRNRWLTSFENRGKITSRQHDISIERADTQRFTIFALVGRVGIDRADTVEAHAFTENGVNERAAIGSETIGGTIFSNMASAYGFKQLRSLGVRRDSDMAGTSVPVSWKADGHIVELRYKYKQGWSFDGYYLDNQFMPLPRTFNTRDEARDFFLNVAYRNLIGLPCS